MNERKLDRSAAKRLAILRHAEEVTGNLALTCRFYGITRQAFCQRRRRYQAAGTRALPTPAPTAFCQRPCTLAGPRVNLGDVLVGVVSASGRAMAGARACGGPC